MALAACVVGAVVARRHAMLRSLLIFAATFFLGVTLMARQKQSLSVELPRGETAYKAVLLSEPEVHGRVVRADLQLLTGPLTGRKVKASILRDTIAHRYLRLHVGDGILAASLIDPPRNYPSADFDYALYLKRHGYAGTTFIYFTQWRKVSASLAALSPVARTRLAALRLRQSLVETLRTSGLSDNALALAAAMTLGHKAMLSRSIKDDFSISGGSHVLALSGLHLSIIYSLLSLLFVGGRRAIVARVLTLATVWVYVVLVGMSPSVMRSAWMLTIYSFVSLLQRGPASLNTLALAAILLLTASPVSLFDVGFQLSFMAVLFILLLFAPIYNMYATRWLRRTAVTRWLWTTAVLSLVAQMGVAPLIAHHFHRFSTYFLLTNFLVIPCTIAIIYTTLALLVLSPLRAPLAAVLSAVATLMLTGIRAINALPAASIDNIHINAAQTLLLYVFIFAVCLFVRRLSSVSS